MSFNMSTMPGCAENYDNPIEEWVRQGYTCQDCAWEMMCLDSFIADEKSKRKPYDQPDDAVPVENITTE